MNSRVHRNRKWKAAEDWPHSRTLRDQGEVSSIRQVLEFGQSSAALAMKHTIVLIAITLGITVAHAEKTNGAFTIDLPTALRLANARNLDVQIARERLREAQGERDIAVSQFFPWISAG